jgi:hypothetical protein
MLTEPASAQREAFEFPGIPILPTLKYLERHPARKHQVRSGVTDRTGRHFG